MTDFAQMVAAALAARGLSYREFATKVGCSHQLVSLVVKGKRAPPAALLPRFAKVLNVPVRDVANFLTLGASAKAHRTVAADSYITGIETDLADLRATMARVHDALAAIAPLLPKRAQTELASLLKQTGLAKGSTDMGR